LSSLFIALLLASPAPANSPQWRSVATGVTASLRGLAVSGHSIWASGSGGSWLRSPDDGKTWTHGVVPGGESLDFRGVFALDEKTAVLISSGPAEKNQAHIYRTRDAGAHWVEVFHGTKPGMFFDAVKFWDARHGIVLSDPIEGKFAILLTDDGGLSWREAPRDNMPAALPNEGAFAASSSALAVWGKSEAWFGTGGAAQARIFRSHDRGASWSAVNTPIAAGLAEAGIFSLLIDGRSAVAVGGNYQRATTSVDNIAFSGDGGNTWKLAEAGFPLFLSGITHDRSSGYVAVGTGGWAHSADGRHWTAESEGDWNAVALSRTRIWAAGAKGKIGYLERASPR
jgi:photosystem II stability/assembly factor-like uncharacterized protein